MSYIEESDDIAERIRSTDPKLVLEGMKLAMIKHSQGENLHVLYEDMCKIDTFNSIKLKRYRNIILSDKVDMMDTIISEYNNAEDSVTKTLCLKKIGFITSFQNAERAKQVINKASQDKDCYVRKAAVFSILKMDQNDTMLLQFFNLGDILKNFLNDPDISVAANACSAIIEINMRRDVPLIKPTAIMIFGLLSNIFEANEWVKIQVLNFILLIESSDEQQSLSLVKFLTDLLTISTSLVTFPIIKGILHMLNFVSDENFKDNVKGMLKDPFLKLLTSSPETQLVVLKSYLVLYIKYKFPVIDVSKFFWKESDPNYLKLTKLDVIKMLVNSENVAEVVNELRKYCKFGDDELTNRGIRELAQISLKHKEMIGTCLDIFKEVIYSDNFSAIQECIIQSVNILKMCDVNTDSCRDFIRMTFGYADDMTESRAKCALIWMYGEFCELSPRVEFNLFSYLTNILEECSEVQNEIITASIKFVLNFPASSPKFIEKLAYVMENSTDPDVSDRAFFYLNLLTNDIFLTTRMFNVSHAGVYNFSSIDTPDLKLVDKLSNCLGSIANVLFKFPEEVTKTRPSHIFPVLLGYPKSSVEIRGELFSDQNGRKIMNLYLRNFKDQVVNLKSISINPNFIGITIKEHPGLPKLFSFSVSSIFLPLVIEKQEISKIDSKLLVTITTDKEKLTFEIYLKLSFILKIPEIQISPKIFQTKWSSIKDCFHKVINDPITVDIDNAKALMIQENIKLIARTENNKVKNCFFYSNTIYDGELILVIQFDSTENTLDLKIKTDDKSLGNFFLDLVSRIFELK